MKKLPVIFLLLASLHARADVVVVETIKNSEQTVSVTTKVKGDKSRTDITNQATDSGDSSRSIIIANTATGDIVTLVPAIKSYVKFSSDTAKLIVGDIQKSQADAGAPPKIVDTGKKEKVNGIDTEIYTAQTAAGTYTYWVTKDYENLAAIQDQMRKFHTRQNDLKRKLGVKEDTGPDIWKVDGLAIKTETVNAKGVTSITTLDSAKEQDVDDAEFQVPADYTDLETHHASPPVPPRAQPVATPPAIPMPPAVPFPGN